MARGWLTIRLTSGCNPYCVFGQNSELSSQVHGEPVAGGLLAAMLPALQDRGGQNINPVTSVKLSRERQQDIDAVPEPARTI